MEFKVVNHQQRKGSTKTCTAVTWICRKAIYFQATSRYKRAVSLVMSAWFGSAKLERNLGYCLRRNLPSNLSQCGLYAPLGPTHWHYLFPDSPSSASSFEISYRRFKNSSLVISSTHTFPLFQCPVQTFYALTGKHPELGILVPVVFGGSCSSSVGVANTAPLCVVKTSVPTRHCSSLVWGGKGGLEEHTVIQFPTVIMKQRCFTVP